MENGFSAAHSMGPCWFAVDRDGCVACFDSWAAADFCSCGMAIYSPSAPLPGEGWAGSEGIDWCAARPRAAFASGTFLGPRGRSGSLAQAREVLEHVAHGDDPDRLAVRHDGKVAVA